ncbi:GNAT family N-acetyltransferase [Solibacillus silvestris]|uniref:GNAT family N-acetyltransferase n=1 Tax=Solibacillus silvestris TaxID=76853 RepID=UPI003F7DE280
MNFSFQDIHIFAEIEKETELFKHYKLDEIKDRYDSNFVYFRRLPTLQELKETQFYLTKFQRSRRQKFLKFVFPQDVELPFYIRQYFSSQQFNIGILEMYAIQPNVFTKERIHPSVKIEPVTARTIDSYLALQYEEDLQWGESYANGKRAMLKRDFEQHRKQQFIALIDERVVGIVDVIESQKTAEIDNFFVSPQFQRQGIGTTMQQYIMENYERKVIILVADGKDTPREMYTKQGYTYIGKQYNALKMNFD